MGHELREDGAARQHPAFWRDRSPQAICPKNASAEEISSPHQIRENSCGLNRLYGFSCAMTGHQCPPAHRTDGTERLQLDERCVGGCCRIRGGSVNRRSVGERAFIDLSSPLSFLSSLGHLDAFPNADGNIPSLALPTLHRARVPTAIDVSRCLPATK